MWDTIYTWLLATVATFDGLTESTYDADPVTRDKLLAYAVVGDEDPDGFYEQDDDAVDTLLVEQGEVAIRFVSRSGDNDTAPHRATTKTWVDTLRDRIKADPTLGGLFKQGSTVHLGRVEVRQQKQSGGARVERAVTVRYLTRL